MKISELCELAGVTPSTLKYYVREGLVPEGHRTSTNRTEYSEAHVQRVKLARALVETGALCIAAARQVLDVLDANQDSIAYVFDAAQKALSGGRAVATQPTSEASLTTTFDLVERHSWATSGHNPGNTLVARALDGLATIGYTPSQDYLDAYAEAASIVAKADLAALSDRSSPTEIAELMVVGTVMGDVLIAGLRRLAQEHETAAHFPSHESPETDNNIKGDHP